MRHAAARWTVGLAVLALPIAGPLRAAPLSAQDVVTRCVSQGGPGAKGISALEEACPGVEKALDQLGLTALLPAGWRKTLSARELAEVDALVRRYRGPPASGMPKATALRAIAERMVPPLPPSTWSRRFEGWIRHWTEPLVHQVRQWLRSLGPGAGRSRLARTIFHGLVALLLAAVVALLVLEVRGTGLIRRRRTPPRPGHGAGIALADPPETRSAEPEWAQLSGSPARVLRLLVEALTRSRRLEHDRNLTCRELAERARLDTEVEREDFARVSRLAERELYGPPGTAPVPDEVLRGARMLHARLLAAAARSQGLLP